MLEQIGTIGVDAGLCWVGDPCYVFGNDASHSVKSWTEFCDTLYMDANKPNEPLGSGIGFAIPTGYGDGLYPVYIRHNQDGRIAEIKIVFIEDE